MALDFEQLAEHQVSLSAERTITEADVRAFAELTGDWNEIHFNDEVARASRYGQRIAHGALVFSISIGLLQSDPQAPDVIAFVGVERLRFVRPVFLGDTIHVRQTVRSVEAVSADSGLLEATEEVVNQSDSVTLSFTAKFLIRRTAGPARPEPRGHDGRRVT